MPVPDFSIQAFPQFPELTAFFSLRMGGISAGKFSSLNLGFSSGDNAADIENNWRITADACALERERILLPRQTHSNRLLSPQDFTTGRLSPEGDAVFSAVPGDIPAVTTADCLPVLLYDPASNTGAAIHAGWKGTVSGVLEKSLSRLLQAGQINRNSVCLSFGPCLQIAAFEVKSDVSSLFPDECIQKSDSRLFLDLPLANLKQALKLGIPRGNILISTECTFSSPHRFFSWRRDGNPTGRMASLIQIPG